jgi:hypothetical protein
MQYQFTKAIDFQSTKYKEDVMRALTALTGILAPVSAFAASGGRVDDSGIFVWVFLGFCALIVVAQIVPAVLLMFGMAKGIGSVVKEEMAAAKK